jgi:hypothetical protein
LKLHGSTNFDILYYHSKYLIKFSFYYEEPLEPSSSLLFPQTTKPYDQPPFNSLWISAAQALQQSDEIFVIGYSFPSTDIHSETLFRLNVGRNRSLRRLVIVNPDSEARQRTRYAMARGIGMKTKVVELHYLSEVPGLLEQREKWIQWEKFRRRSQRLSRERNKAIESDIAQASED